MKGSEVAFGTIGDASTSEGHFFETMNAAGVLQVPMAISVWDDDYGISVHKSYQTTKQNISRLLKGFEKDHDGDGFLIYTAKGWDYPAMVNMYNKGVALCRQNHIPVLFHISEMTQPQGHSTSGSHERYKKPERLAWEKEWDCIKQMREWILANFLAEEYELAEIELNAKLFIKESKQNAWEKYIAPIQAQVQKTTGLLDELAGKISDPASEDIKNISAALGANKEPMRREVMKAMATALDLTGNQPATQGVQQYYAELKLANAKIYNTLLYNEGPKSAMNVTVIKPYYADDAPTVNGYEVLNKYFDVLFASNNKVAAFGEDLGFIGDVNQGFSGLQEKYGNQRIFDSGIRELSIMGQGIGMALRGLRPIAEIQYLDYLLYGLQTLSDDLATIHYRTAGQQSCPMIVRTRGHRLEGIWHSGSPMGMIINSLRGLYVCVPRNMVQAAGMYNTLLQSNDPALMIECLNGYRLKEKLPSNLLAFTVPLGIPETMREGTDITLVSYGSTLRIVMEATLSLDKLGISCEVIDVQTLLPFDINHDIVKSLIKTNRIVFIDEDVPGGAAAYMFNKVMEEQGGYKHLDVAPRTITGKAHRPSYASDGDYFSKPNVEEIISVIKDMMAE